MTLRAGPTPPHRLIRLPQEGAADGREFHGIAMQRWRVASGLPVLDQIITSLTGLPPSAERCILMWNTAQILHVLPGSWTQLGSSSVPNQRMGRLHGVAAGDKPDSLINH